MAKSPARRPVQSRRPAKPLPPTTLRRLGRWFRWLAALAIGLWISAVDAAIVCLVWPYRNPIRSLKLAWLGLWRAAAAISVGYLVFDRIYETNATMASPASDPNEPFRMPFSITNNSHIFALKNLSWTCTALSIRTENNTY